MPAATAPQATGRSGGKETDTQKARAAGTTKKRRVTRRRGRARGELDSDDEIEREAATDDSDSEEDLSDNSSATDDSDTEPASEDVITHDRTHLPTPRNSKSPESVVKGDPPSFFAPGASWSEIVDEGANDSGDLPVVDFAEFGTKPLPQPTKPPTKKAKRAAAKAKKRVEVPAPLPEPIKPAEDPAPAPNADGADGSSATATEVKRGPPHARHPLPGHSARQLYQQKLETDPSYIPTIGNFWSHDDRLIDTELRNLSGWWRGRGGRGRGRGGFAVRGRGGFNGTGGREADPQPSTEENVPPIEKAWTHDGFEEMKKRDEHRRAEQAAARQAQASPKRGFAGRGRGSFVPSRGRGGYARGGLASPVNGRYNNLTNRGRFAMKPELMWTKQHEAFLYFDTTMKPRPGQGAGFRIRLPGQKDIQVVRAPPGPTIRPVASSSKTEANYGPGEVVVCLPKRPSKKGKQASVAPAPVVEPAHDTSVSHLDVETKPAPLPSQDEPSVVPPSPRYSHSLSEQPLIVTQLEQVAPEPTLSDPQREAQTEQAVLRNPPTDASADAPESTSATERPVLPPLQTTFTPPPPPPPPQPMSQPSPAYGSTYAYPVALPPGIAMNANGMPYEVATGRLVYLQPPPPMYNTRPMMHSHYPHPSMTFHPGHMQHPSLSSSSPDFVAQPPSQTPPVNGFIDPATGTPIFSFPRQTTRIEIRAPTDPQAVLDGIKLAGSSASTKASVPRTPSGLRTAAPTFQPQPTRPIGYYQHPQSATPSDSYEPSATTTPGHAHSSSMEDAAASMGGGMMQPYHGHYPHPQHHPHQAYYYPEPYGYPQYMDMSHAGQTYDMYGMEQAPQGTVYY